MNKGEWLKLSRQWQYLQNTLHQIQEHTKSIAKNTEPKEKTDDIHDSIPSDVLVCATAKPTFPVAAASHYDPKKDERPRSFWGWLRLAIEVVGLLALVAYVIVAGWTFSEIKRQNRLDKQAWVMPFEFKKTINTTGDTTGANVFYKNTGKTPALNFHIFIGWAARDNLIPSGDERGTQEPTFAIAPDGVGNSAAVIPPEVIQSVLQGNPGGYIFGTIWYNDIFGGDHW